MLLAASCSAFTLLFPELFLPLFYILSLLPAEWMRQNWFFSPSFSSDVLSEAFNNFITCNFFPPQTSHSSNKHLPGFRKILPRANCFLVPNSASSNYQAVGSQSEVCIESIDFSAEGSLCSVALRVPKSKVAPVDLAAEVEISDPSTVPSDTAAEETVVSSYVTPQRTLPWSSSKTLTSTDTQGSQGSVDEMLNDVSLKTKASGVAVQMMQREATQMVTIVPSQVRSLRKWFMTGI